MQVSLLAHTKWWSHVCMPRWYRWGDLQWDWYGSKEEEVDSSTEVFYAFIFCASMQLTSVVILLVQLDISDDVTSFTQQAFRNSFYYHRWNIIDMHHLLRNRVSVAYFTTKLRIHGLWNVPLCLYCISSLDICLKGCNWKRMKHFLLKSITVVKLLKQKYTKRRRSC